MTSVQRTDHSMTRVDVFTGVGFDEFLTAFEAAAPAFGPVPIQRIVESGGAWDDVRAKAAENAPNELMVYAKIDATPTPLRSFRWINPARRSAASASPKSPRWV